MNNNKNGKNVMTKYQIDQDDLDDLSALLCGISEYIAREPNARRASELDDMTSAIREILSGAERVGASN
jgi:hypothetical protein